LPAVLPMNLREGVGQDLPEPGSKRLGTGPAVLPEILVGMQERLLHYVRRVELRAITESCG
jgi:hypothetical protein